MEFVESLADMDWSSLMSGMMYTNEEAEADFMAQLLSNFPISYNHETTSNPSTTSPVDSSYFFSPSSPFWPPSAASQGSSSSSTGGFYATSHQDASMDLHQLLDSSSLPPLVSSEDGPKSMGLCVGEEAVMNTSSYLADESEEMTLIPEIAKKKAAPQKKPAVADAGEAEAKPNKGPKKRARATSGEVKPKKNARPKKAGKKQNSSAGVKIEEESNVKAVAVAPSNCCSEDESFVNEGGEAIPTTTTTTSSSTVSSNGKTRASRGAATDPQSLYARKRRERINERLKVLQTIVPNGTKVDISTMLEEAVQYVKFLQLQIKLLSSDDHWMYAPIAYNGMNIGLDHLKIPQHI